MLGLKHLYGHIRTLFVITKLVSFIWIRLRSCSYCWDFDSCRIVVLYVLVLPFFFNENSVMYEENYVLMVL